MAHHGGSDFPGDFDSKMNVGKAFNQEKTNFRGPSNLSEQLGATGKFPEGKLNDADKGEIMVAVGKAGDKIIVDFGPEPVKWVGLNHTQAIELGRSLLKHAGVVVTIEIPGE